MTKNWSFSKITEILKKKLRTVIVSQNHYLNKILDVHPLWNTSLLFKAPRGVNPWVLSGIAPSFVTIRNISSF